MSDNRPKISNHWFCNKLVTVFFLLLIVGCDSPAQKEANYFKRGVALYEQGEDAKAMLEFRNVLRLNPKNADALYHVGLIQERGQQLPQAFRMFQAATAEKPDLLPAQIKLGTLALAGDELAVAEQAADAIEKLQPNNADGLAIRAATMLRKGDLQRALDTAETVLTVAPEHENAAAVKAGVLNARKRPGEALAFLDETLRRIPKSISLRQIKITLLADAGDADGVMQTFDELLELSPDKLAYRLGLANYLQARGDLTQAESVLRIAMEHGLTEPETVSALVRLIQQKKGAVAAEAELKRLIEQDPKERSRQLLLADLYMEEKKPAEAEGVLQRVIEEEDIATVADDARVRLARIRFESGDKAGAAALADEVLGRSGSNREAHLVKAVLALDAGDAEEAIRRGRTALRQDQGWRPALLLLAEAHQRKGEQNLAIDALGTVLAREPTDSDTATRLARLLGERGDYDAALRIWDQVIAQGGATGEALQARATIAIRDKNWQAAQDDIDRLLAMPDHQAVGAKLAGELAIGEGQPDNALTWFTRALAADPGSDQSLIGVIRSYVARGDLDGAIAYLDEHKGSRPDDAVPYQLLGELFVRRGDAGKAEAAFRQAIQSRPAWLPPYIQLAALLERTGRAGDAAAVYEQALAQDPRNTGLNLQLAQSYQNVGRINEALQAYERLLQFDPNVEPAINNYAALVADYRNDDTEALARALTLATRFQTSENGNLLDTLGWLYYRTGDFNRAVGILERASLLVPNDPQLRYHLGMALAKAGQKERAVDELAQATPTDANYPGLDEARATLQQLRAEVPPAAPAKP